MSDNVATVEQPVVPQETQVDETLVPASPDANQIMAESLWGNQPTPYQNPEAIAQPETPAATEQQVQPATPSTNEEDKIWDFDEYFKQEFGIDPNTAKTEWAELRKLKETPPTPQEVKWSYDDSKEEELYNYIHQKRELAKLESMEVANSDQAAEILKANLQFKYKGTLTPQEIDRIFSKQYALPAQPSRDIDHTDEEHAEVIKAWESQVAEKKMDMIIEAKMAKPELSKFKDQIVLPDIQKPQVQPQGPTQEELAAMEAGRQAYLKAVDSNYQNFKGFSVTAVNGAVQLPISYGVSPEEVTASKQEVENFNVNDFFGTRWFDENGNPRVNLMQEDLYLLKNRDRIFQKMCNEGAAQMQAHLIKNQNNINLKGVNPTLGPTPPAQQPAQTPSQRMAEQIWSM